MIPLAPWSETSPVRLHMRSGGYWPVRPTSSRMTAQVKPFAFERFGMPTKGSGHGLKGTPEYSTWVNMRQRCNNPQGHDVHRYSSISEASDLLGVGIMTVKHWCDGKTTGKYRYPPKLNCRSEKKYVSE